ncbi:MAG: NAD(P)-dependent oxidoreductase [Burkholderiaceae bacterium]|nr:NAD(P)-dependent oxidoreductase [Burkholderiaceae bacterium]
MKILVTGGCGNMGPHVVRFFVQHGHQVRVLDRDADGLKQFTDPQVETVAGNINDRETVRRAVQGTDAILHLAWSFSEDLNDLLDIDVKGYRYLLDAAVEFGVSAVVNATTAVSYGKPLSTVVDETQPHLVAKARNPIYGLAKLATEELSQIYAEQHGLAANNVMIWYAYGDVIGGRNLRNMAQDAIEKGVIEVPAGCGGSFLQLDDFAACVLAIFQAQPKGELFNVGTMYLTWEELAQMIVAHANPAAKVIGVPKEQWTGSAFLVDDWQFSTAKVERLLGYRSALSREQAIAHLSQALAVCVAGVKAKLRA